MKLIGSYASPFVRKVRIVLAEKKIDYDLEIDDPWKDESRARRVNPLSQVPVLVLDDGTALYDSRVIVEYLDSASPLARLIPADKRERIEARRWEALADGILDAAVLARMERLRTSVERSESWIARQLRKVAAGLELMDKDLGSNVWCAGNAYSLADIAIGSCLGWLLFRFPELDWQAERLNLARHFIKLSERASFIDTAPHE